MSKAEVEDWTALVGGNHCVQGMISNGNALIVSEE